MQNVQFDFSATEKKTWGERQDLNFVVFDFMLSLTTVISLQKACEVSCNVILCI